MLYLSGEFVGAGDGVHDAEGNVARSTKVHFLLYNTVCGRGDDHDR